MTAVTLSCAGHRPGGGGAGQSPGSLDWRIFAGCRAGLKSAATGATDTTDQAAHRILAGKTGQATWCSSARRAISPALFDLDGFKARSTTPGYYHTGDAPLIDLPSASARPCAQDTARLLATNSSRPGARSGGNLVDAANVADRLIEAIARPVVVYGHVRVATSAAAEFAIYPTTARTPTPC